MLVSCGFVECFYCNFVEIGFKEFCMGCVRRRGYGTVGMSTRVGELRVCVCVCVCVCRFQVVRNPIYPICPPYV